MKKRNSLAVIYRLFVIMTAIVFLLNGCTCRREPRSHNKSRSEQPSQRIREKQNSTDKDKLPQQNRHASNTIPNDHSNSLDLKNHPSESNILRGVSLRKLIAELRKNPNSPDAQKMYGLSWLEGYVIDSTQNDVILYGRELGNWPNIDLFDFIENLQNVYSNQQAPYCSLDPKPENVVRLNNYLKQKQNKTDISRIQELLGEQISVTGGVPSDSRHALIMLQADYHMKKVSQGLIRLPNVPSYLDLAVENDHNAGWSRFWFNYAESSPQYIANSNIMEIEKCNIILSTKGMNSTRSGDLFDSGVEDPVAENFAKTFSENFLNSTQKVTVYADLENLYRLQGILKSMMKNDVLRNNTEIIDFFLNEFTNRHVYPVPKSYDGLVNELQSLNADRSIFVMGGVSMEASSPVWHTQTSRSTPLSRKRDVIIKENSTDKTSFVIDMKERKLLFIFFWR